MAATLPTGITAQTTGHPGLHNATNAAVNEHEGRLVTLEGSSSDYGSRLTAVEDKATNLDTRATALESEITDLTPPPGWTNLGTISSSTTLPLDTAQTVEVTLGADITLTLTGTTGDMLLVPHLSGHTLTLAGVTWMTDMDTTGAIVLVATPSKILAWPVVMGTQTPDLTAPTWSATLTTGSPDATMVDITCSAMATDDRAVVGYQWRAGATDTWRNTVTATGKVLRITGLTASTAYPAPDFRAYDKGGNFSNVLTAQAFTTAATPKAWTTLWSDDFNGATTDTHLLGRTTPVGGKTWVLPIGANENQGLIQVRPSGVIQTQALVKAFPTPEYRVTGGNADRTMRLTMAYNLAAANGSTATLGKLSFVFAAGIPQSSSVGIKPNGDIAFAPYVPSLDGTETSGLTTAAPTSGTAVLTITDATMTLAINGTTLRAWALTWKSPTSVITDAGIATVAAANSVETIPAWADGTIDSITCQVWR